MGLFVLVFFSPAGADQADTVRPLFPDAESASHTKFFDADLLQSRVVRPDLAVLEQAAAGLALDGVSAEFALNLFADAEYVALLKSSEELRWGGRGWVGRIQDCSTSELFLVQREKVLVGSANCDGRVFQMRSTSSGTMEIRELNSSSVDESQPDSEPAPFNPPPSSSFSSPFNKGGLEKSDSSARIDVLIGYSTDAMVAAGGQAGMTAMIDLAILETNTGYADSGISQRLRLVHAVEVNYTETGSSSTDLSRLYSLSDGYLDELHTLRNTYGADMISFWTATMDGCGRGYLMTSVSSSFASAALNVVQIGCATGYYSFGHELGHNMGARHDWYVDDATGSPYSHNKGHVNTAGGWRTIMAYESLCSDLGGSCTRVQHFSNPDVNYLGAPTGVASGTGTTCTTGNLANPYCDADNRLTLNNTASTVANFRQTQFYASLTQSASPSTVDVGETITLTLEARNDTEVTATGIVIESDVPAGTTLDGSSLSPDAIAEGTDSGSGITWTTGTDLAPGQTLTRTFTLYADSSGIVVSQATVTSTNGSVASPSNSSEITVLYHAACGFSEGFESGSLSAYWQTETTFNGRVSVIASVPDTGSYSAVLDASTSGTFSESAMILTADLSGSGQSQLSFRWQDFGDEYHSGYDGVFIREDKDSSWHKVFDFEGSIHGVYQDGAIDIDAAASAAGFVVGDGFQVKFSQYDNWYINTTSPASGDGYSFDGLSLVCTPQEVATTEPTRLLAVGKDGFEWGADANAASYNLYRGEAGYLSALSNANTDTCLRWNGSGSSVSGLSELPTAGQGYLYFYLITGENSLGESTAGPNADGQRQLNSGGGC